MALGLRYRFASVDHKPSGVGRIRHNFQSYMLLRNTADLKRVTFVGAASIYYKMVIHFYKSGAERTVGPVPQVMHPLPFSPLLWYDVTNDR